MIQRNYFEIGKRGYWSLFKVTYYYRNKFCWYYELHKRDNRANMDIVIRFGEKGFDDLKLLIQGVKPLNSVLSNIEVVDSETVVISDKDVPRVEDWC